MNKILASIVVCFLLITVSAKADLKVATVDIQEVFKNYYKTQEAEQRMQTDTAKYRSDGDNMMEDYRKLVSQANDQGKALQDPTLSESAKKEKQNKMEELVSQIRNKEQEIRNYEQTTSKLMQDQSLRTRKSIIDEINKTIENFSKGKFNMVIDKSGISLNSTPTLMYSEGLTDITDDVIKQLNASKPAAGAATTTSGSAAKK